MKKLSILASTLLLGGIIVFVSCTKTGPQGPSGQNGATGATGATGPTGPVIYGTITGNVIMTNIYGAPVTNDYGGGYILLKNATTGIRVDSIVANAATGAFAIDSVPTGTYNMFCIYSGYGENVHQNVEVNGNLQVDNKLSAIPSFNVTTAVDSLGTTNRDKANLYIGGTIAADGNGERTILVFAGTSSSVASAPGTYSFLIAKTIPQDSTSYNFAIPLNTIYGNGFAYGSNVYFTIYGAANNYNYGDYTNYTYGQFYYSAITSTGVTVAPTITLP